MSRALQILLLAAAAAAAEEPISIRPAPCITWSASSGVVYTVERSETSTGTWSTAGTVYSPATGSASWADSTPAPASFYRVAAITGAPADFVETFEDEGGWTDQPSGNWTNWAATGKWVGKGCFASSSPILAHSPVRCICMNEDWQRIYFPVGGTITQIQVWYRGSQEMSQQAVFRLVGNDGSKEYQIDYVQQVDTVSWTSRTWSIASPDTWRSFYIDTFWNYSPIYLDDISVWY